MLIMAKMLIMKILQQGRAKCRAAERMNPWLMLIIMMIIMTKILMIMKLSHGQGRAKRRAAERMDLSLMLMMMILS